MKRSAAIATVWVALSAVMPLFGQENLPPTFDDLFQTVTNSSGDKYRQARDAILAMGDQAIPLLEAKVEDDNWIVRMTAEICLGWLRYPEEYRRWREVIDGRAAPDLLYQPRTADPEEYVDMAAGRLASKPPGEQHPTVLPLVHEALFYLPPERPKYLTYEERQRMLTKAVTMAKDPSSVELALSKMGQGRSPADWIFNLLQAVLVQGVADTKQLDRIVNAALELFATSQYQPVATRTQAIKALGCAAEHPAAAGILVALARRDNVPEVRAAAASALGWLLGHGSLDADQIIATLGDLLEREESAEVRRNAVHALGHAYGPYSYQPTEEWRMRILRAIELLEAHAGRNRDPELKPLVDDNVAKLRYILQQSGPAQMGQAATSEAAEP